MPVHTLYAKQLRLQNKNQTQIGQAPNQNQTDLEEGPRNEYKVESRERDDIK